MDINETLQLRHSTRAFTERPVDSDLLLSLLETAGNAPSYANSQPWEVFAAAGAPLDGLRKGFLEKFRAGEPIHPDIPMAKLWPEPYKTYIETTGAASLKHLGIARDDKPKRTENIENNLTCFGAPAVVYLCLHKETTPWSIYDLGLFSASFMLAAQQKGLGTIPAAMLVVYPELIRQELLVPDHLNIILGIAVGYAKEGDLHNSFHSARKPTEDFVRLKGFES